MTRIIESINCVNHPPYELQYYSPELLPYKQPFPVDFFGYFNNVTGLTKATAFLPRIYENAAAINGERFRIYDRPGAGYTTVLSSTARDVNPSTVHYGSLKKIIFPTGGFAELTYEPNDYWDEIELANHYGAGVRVSQVKVSDGDPDTSNDMIKNYSYKQSDGTSSSGRWKYNPSFAFKDGANNVYSPDNLAPSDVMMYERSTTSVPGNGRI